MRLVALCSAGVLCGCAAAPPPAPPSPPKVAVAEPKPGAEAARPEPLATEQLELTQKSEFLSLDLGPVDPPLLSDDELLRRLPPTAQADFRAVETARRATRDAEQAASLADLSRFSCETCQDERARAAKYEAASRAAARAESALAKARERAEKSLERQLASPKAVPEIGIALARIQLRAGILSGQDDLAYSPRYGEERQSLDGVDALERAAELAGPDVEAGQRVRQELLCRLGAKRDAARARSLIDELMTHGPGIWRAELYLRAGLFDALEGHDAEAAEQFEKGLKAHVAGSGARRRTLATGILVARYRALDFERALPAAIGAFEELQRPEPEPPAPPAPPPKPKPKPKPRAAKRSVTSAELFAELSGMGMISALSPGSELGERGVLRLATDSLERLDRDPESVAGPVEARAGILSLLAARALYRNDPSRARRLADSAVQLGPLAETRDALNVLRALALADDDTPRAQELEKRVRALPWGRSSGFWGLADEPALRDLTDRLGHGSRAADAKKQEEPAVARMVRSALRVCLEPVRANLPPAPAGDSERRIAVLTLNAQVFENGSVKIDADADRKLQGLEPVLDCLRQMGPRVLARSPSSVSATIVLDDSVRRSEGGLGLSDQSLGGFGGLGIGHFGGAGRGAGGGLGSIGGLTRGSGRATPAGPRKPQKPAAGAKAQPKK